VALEIATTKYNVARISEKLNLLILELGTFAIFARSITNCLPHAMVRLLARVIGIGIETAERVRRGLIQLAWPFRRCHAAVHPPPFRMRFCRTIHLRAPRAVWRPLLSADWRPSLMTYAAVPQNGTEAGGLRDL
jgi:hypothetical protein